MVSFSSGGDAGVLIKGCDRQPGQLFASLGWGILGPARSEVLSVKEKRTGVEFDGEFCYRRGQHNCPKITGAGARTKKIAGIKSLDVYALALYADPSAAHSALHRKFAKSSPEELAKNQALFDELSKASGVEKSLVLVITSGLVKRKAFLDALNERLAAPLSHAKQGAALDAFTSQFDAVEFRKGLQISFTFIGNKLVTKADGKELGTLTNKALSSTLLDIYLGSDPVSKGAKEEFGAGLARMVLA